jgi:hypothetical protein
LYLIKAFYDEAIVARNYLDFMFDGIVVSYTDENLRARLGRQNFINKYSMAVKFPALRKETIFIGYTYEVGQHGQITPMIHYNPVEFNGTIHTKSSGSSLKRFNDLALKVGDLDFNIGEVVVFGKGHKERVVYLSNICIKYVQEYLDERKAQHTEPLFCRIGNHNKNITVRDAQLLLKDLEHRSGVENVHPHRFRRTMATHALERGVPIEQIKEILGHSRIDTTMIYVNVSAARVKDSFKHAFNGRIDASKLEEVEEKDDE